MTEKKTALHIVALEVENVKRIRAVRIRPDGALVIVGGRNAQGKSSLLDAIEMALYGARAIPPDPVRHGARKGRSFIDLGEVRVERVFSKRGSKLVVTGANGQTCASPQTLLDSFCTAISFDPLGFARLKPGEQVRTVEQLLDLDFGKIDRERSVVYDQRTEAKRELKSMESRIDVMAAPIGAPTEEQNMREVLAELERRQAAVRAQELERRALDAAEKQLSRMLRRVEEAALALAEMEKQKAAATITAETLRESVREHRPVDVETVTEQLAGIETHNKSARAAKEREALASRIDEAERHIEKLTGKINDIDQKKQDDISAAQLPVPGISWDQGGLLLDGVPFEQASQAEKLRVSVAIGAALNPRVKVMLVRDGSLLDTEGLRLLAKLARDSDCQVFLERVSEDGEGCSVVIEDGAVKGELGEHIAPAEDAPEGDDNDGPA